MTYDDFTALKVRSDQHIAWDDAPSALAESPEKPIVERERLLTSSINDVSE